MNKFQSFGWEINQFERFQNKFSIFKQGYKTDWLIIGGGLTGLSALNQLKNKMPLIQLQW